MTIKNIVRVLLFAALLMPPAAASAQVSLSKDIQPILNKRCVACHLPGAAMGELVLTKRQVAEELIGKTSSQVSMPRIAPGDPGRSYLLHKLLGTHQDVGGEGVRMPLEQGSLSETELTLIRQWIEEGAHE